MQIKSESHPGELSEAMKIDAATIRRDFSHFGALGRKGYGYDVQYLVDFFRTILDQDVETNVALFGVGSLGNAFLKYNFQKKHNTRIIMAFDPKASRCRGNDKWDSCLSSKCWLNRN